MTEFNRGDARSLEELDHAAAALFRDVEPVSPSEQVDSVVLALSRDPRLRRSPRRSLVLPLIGLLSLASAAALWIGLRAGPGDLPIGAGTGPGDLPVAVSTGPGDLPVGDLPVGALGLRREVEALRAQLVGLRDRSAALGQGRAPERRLISERIERCLADLARVGNRLDELSPP